MQKLDALVTELSRKMLVKNKHPIVLGKSISQSLALTLTAA